MSTVSYIPNFSGLAYQKYQLNQFRSSALSLRSLRSAKSLKSLNSTANFSERWWQRRPILIDALYTSLQKASYHVAILIIIETSLQILISMFNIYCLFFLASPGSKHFRQLGISFIFVYTGNKIVRYCLILCSSVLLISAIFLLSTTIILLKALKKESELKFIYFIKTLIVFGILRFLIMIFELIVNDLYYFYHQFNLILWTLFSVINLFAYLVVLSNYQELKDITQLQDMAKEKAASMNTSRSLQNASHLCADALSTISNKLLTSTDFMRNQSSNNQSSLTSSPSSVCGSTISETFDRVYRDQEKQLMMQQQQIQQFKLNQAYNQLKNSNNIVPMQSPSLL